MTLPALMCALLLSAAPDPAPPSPCPPPTELRAHPPVHAVPCTRPWTEPPECVPLRLPLSAVSGSPRPPEESAAPVADAEPTAPPPARPASGDGGSVRAVSSGEAPAAEPTSVPAVLPSGGPSPTAEPSEAEWSGGPDAETGAVQVVHHVSTTPAPADTVARVVGNTSTVLLALLAVTSLALRLTVGWPRFPEPYLGRRRAGGDRDTHW
ncbi:hypothetical protein [Nocardiopsis changdeensis]|uniref:hypothetical protein n=1 Tax=Nocardiopsis changdeensis TaxID=2831969 RepID=UPI003F4702E1